MYTMFSSGSNGSESVGGMNPSQLGYGSLVASIDLDMSTSTYIPGNPMDCASVGDGFFVVGTKDQQSIIDPTNPESFKSLTLTRNGDFRFGPDGYLVDGQGQVVYGFVNVNDGVDGEGKPTISDQLVPIRLPKMEKAVVDKDTGTVVQPDENGEYDDAIMDDEGNLTEDYEWSYTIHYAVDQTAGEGDEVTKVPLDDYWPPVEEGQARPEKNPLAYAEMSSISIDKKTGCISGMTRDTGEKVVIGYLAMGVVTNPNGVSHTGSSYYRCDAGAGDMRITMLGGVNKELGITNVNGSLWRSQTQGADGENPATLPQLSEVTSAGKDVSLLTGFLEAPNVDLATEITELITTQRGYQANTRIVTVTDSMLEELVNMKR